VMIITHSKINLPRSFVECVHTYAAAAMANINKKRMKYNGSSCAGVVENKNDRKIEPCVVPKPVRSTIAGMPPDGVSMAIA